MPRLTGAELWGHEQGLSEGLAQAREDLLAGIAAVLEVRFGTSGLAILSEIRQIGDLEVLRKLLQSVKQAETPEALRNLWEKL